MKDDLYGENEFEVENILEKKETKIGKVEHLVKWKNVDDLETTWEPADSLESVQILIDNFEKELKTQIDSVYFTDDTGVSYSISATARQEAEQAAENAAQSDTDELFVDVNTVEEVVSEDAAAKSEIQVAEVMIKPHDRETFWKGSDKKVENSVVYRLKVMGIDTREIKIYRDKSDSVTSCLVKMKVTQLKKIEKDTFPFRNWPTKPVDL